MSVDNQDTGQRKKSLTRPLILSLTCGDGKNNQVAVPYDIMVGYIFAFSIWFNKLVNLLSR